MVNVVKPLPGQEPWKPSVGQQIYDGKLQDIKRIIESDRSVATRLDEVRLIALR